MDLNSELRLAVDTGNVELGYRNTYKAIVSNNAKLVVVASKGKAELINDIKHLCKVGNIKVIEFDGNSIDLGGVCGKPYSVNCLAVIEQGNAHLY